ncbi:hypothetical protein CAEBREN_12341 [Caenorhabditis brenneri]|uniref:Uncharacterized protein n=1 Tax=Caenorhabditis brenneri TaxID=135651 RepID=G0NQE2_CAEBE|nr:hypothetical protein CAEBREN_12341 [Caenorhabditis brenneri]
MVLRDWGTEFVKHSQQLVSVPDRFTDFFIRDVEKLTISPSYEMLAP